MSKKYLINDTYYYFAWGSEEKEDLYYAIENYKKIKHIVFFGPEEHEFGNLFTDLASFKVLKRYLKQKNITYEVVISACLDPILNSSWPYKNQKHFLTWEDFFAYNLINYSLQQNIVPFEHNKHISKHFISLNARSHNWRCMFVDYLYKEGLFDYGYVSWHNSDNWVYNYDFKYWKPEIINFDENWLNSTDGILDILHPPERQFKDSLFSIISESNDQVLKITEKTYLPIYHKRPFIVYGAQYFYRFLTGQGFALFDEIIDYSFDDIPNDTYNSGEQRCAAMMKETKKILNYDPNDLYKILKPKIDYNYNNLLRIVSQQKIDDKIKHIISNMSAITNYNSLLDYNNLLVINKHPNFLNIKKEHK
jgi:hypothetical protein